MKNKKCWKYAVLLASLCGSGTLVASGADDAKPRAESYPSFSLYLQALFDYQKARSGGVTASRAIITDGGDDSEKLDDATSNAGSGQRHGYIDTRARQRSTFKSFGLTPITSNDLEKIGINGGLGIFNDHSLQAPPKTTARTSPDNFFYMLLADTDARLLRDIYNTKTININSESSSLAGGTVILPDGLGQASAVVTANENGSLDMTLSSSVRANIYMVDRDGLPGTLLSNAGAIVINNFGINIDDMRINISSQSRNNNSDVVLIKANSQNAVELNLSNARIGVASVTPGAPDTGIGFENIGSPSYFLGFGPDSRLIIAPGMSLSTMLSRPNGETQALATLNGVVGDITLNDITLMNSTNDSSNRVLKIDKVGITGITMIDTRIFIDGQKIIIDMGAGMTNLGLRLDGIAIGSDPSAGSIGELSLENMHISSSRITMAAH